MLLHAIALASRDIAATSSRLAKVARLTECLREAAPDEVRVAVAYLSGELPQGTVGVGWAALQDLPAAAQEPTLEVLEVDAAVSRLQAISGRGSQAARKEELAALLGRATEPEQRLLVGLFLGELRQGALEGVMTDAVAKAADLPLAEVRRAAMLAGDLAAVAEAALRDGADGLAHFRLTPLQPVGPMLAQTAADIPAALERVEACLSRVEARRRTHPGASRRGRGRDLHAQPRRHHRSRSGDRRRGPRARRLRDRPRRRGDRAPRRRSARAVPGDDEPVRDEDGRAHRPR